MKAMKTRGRKPTPEEPPAPEPVVAATPAAVTEPDPQDARATETAADPVFRLDRAMLLFWLAGAGVLVLLTILDAFYHVIMRH